MSTSQMNAKASLMARVLMTCFLCVVLVGSLFAPPHMAQEIRIRETEAATKLMGPWPQKLSAQAAKVFEMTREQLLMELSMDSFSDTDGSYEKLAYLIRGWTSERMRVLTDAVAVLVLRLSVAVLSGVFFLPAMGAAFYGGIQRREDAKARFSFASPFLMRIRWSVVQMLGMLIVVLSLFPVALPTMIFPLLVGAWALLTGGMVGGLQKEI